MVECNFKMVECNFKMVECNFNINFQNGIKLIKKKNDKIVVLVLNVS